VSGDPRPIIEGADGEPLLLAPEGFAQAHERLNRVLVSTVVDRARCAGRKVLELFAGAGNFTVALARAAKKVSAVELDGRAVAALRENVARRALHEVSARECTAEEAAASHKSFDVVVMDPPRAGAAGVIEAFSTHAPRRLVYVSCEPATFGRDAGRLLDRGMELESIDAFEMFPQTPHVELVAAFSAKRGRP
jgi:23S rRNA (uracil1939-C5)-methyltransferase